MAMRAGAAPAPDGAGFAAVDLALDYPLHEVRRRRAALALSPLGCLPPVGLARQYLPALHRDRLGHRLPLPPPARAVPAVSVTVPVRPARCLAVAPTAVLAPRGAPG